MHSSRTFVRVPTHACRVSRAAAPAARSLSYVPTPFFPRFQSPFTSGGSDFAPLFRLFDDIVTPTIRQAQQPAVFQPRFDVEEVENAYNLRGELPGVEGSDLSVEFTDPQTLVIKGKSERSHTSGTPEAAVESTKQEAVRTNAAPADNSDAESTHSTGSYVQATVEDDPAEPSTSGQATPAESTAENSAPAEEQQAATTTQAEETAPTSHYWVSERSVGSFQRTFNFPGRIDQENVTASLNNGILNITVPKAPAPVARKITVE